MSKQRVYILIGLPGAGKSTWSRNQIAKGINKNGCTIVSRDSIRQMLNGDYKYIEEQQDLITKIAAASASAILERGEDLIVDQANLSKKDRKDVTNFVVKEIGDRDDVDIFFVNFLESNIKTLVDRRLAGDAEGKDRLGYFNDRAYYCKVILKMKEKYDEILSWEDWNFILDIESNGEVVSEVSRPVEKAREPVEEIPKEELWDLTETFAKFAIPRLKAFRKYTGGCPGGIGYEKNGSKTRSERRGPDPRGQLGFEKWQGMLERMIVAFELQLSCHDWDCEVNSKEYHANWAKIAEGLNLFAKYYNGLWW
jgi:predicted kinase